MRRLAQSKYYPPALFLVVLVVALYSVNYFSYLFYHASGIHFWRQTDSVSFVAHYYERGMNFFEPGTYNANSTDGRGASEFPILYYITAALWHVFGRHDSILKIIHSLVFFSGFYCLFKVAIKQIGNIYTALAITMLLLSSTVLLFYANSFLPDAAALGFCLMGAYLYFRFTETKTYGSYLWAYALFTLSVLIKVNMAVFPLAILGLVLLEKVFRLKMQSNGLFAGNIFKYLLPPFVMLVLVVSWVMWTKHYNAINNNYVFLTTIKPYWKADAWQLKQVKLVLTETWFGYYYYYTTWHVFYIIMLSGAISATKWSRHTAWLTAILFTGTFAYGVLFYMQFELHDYYLIPVFVPLAFAIIFSLAAIAKKLSWFNTSYLPAMVIVTVAVLGFGFAKNGLAERTDFKTWSSLNPEVFEISGKLENYGIPKGEQIISFPDRTPNGSLYYLQRQGYTNSSGYEADKVPEIIKWYIFYGIRYIVITDPAYYHLAQSNWYWSKQVGSYKHIKMFYITGYRGDWADKPGTTVTK